jgi:hypothetical protein
MQLMTKRRHETKMKHISVVFCLFIPIIFLLGCGDMPDKGADPVKSDFHVTDNKTIAHVKALKLEEYNGGFFSIKKPVGWDILTAGSCSVFAFYIKARQDNLNQIFYFGTVGPVYMSQQQKQIDSQYARAGGYAMPWQEMPVVYPLTPENFLQKWYAITNTNVARQFMNPVPQLKNIHILSSHQVSVGMGGYTKTKLIRAVFEKNNRVGEGLFLVTVAPYIPYTGGPGGGNAYGLMITGITASKRDFKFMEKTLVQSVRSFNISQQYVSNCFQMQQQVYRGIMRAGQTLRETSDIIMEGWERRNKTYDILAEKRSDVILGKERLYDPDTETVYEFDYGFYDDYKYNKNAYNKTNLIPLPDKDYNLWNTAPLNGYEHVKRE